jgi:TDG/mug DNA glycosylase family protein
VDSLETLPDLLREELDVVFIGINPSVYSAQQGHYFARSINRFWPSFSRSTLSAAARRGLGVDRLEPRHDVLLMQYGIGFTDVVKRPTARASELDAAEFAAGVGELLKKLERAQPLFACFQGMMGYRPFHAVHTGTKSKLALGEQPNRVGRTRLFVVPSPSPANAHATPAGQTEWYDRLAALIAGVGREHSPPETPRGEPL